jgi:hypothetical protein
MTASAEAPADAYASWGVQGVKNTFYAEADGTVHGPGGAIQSFGAGNLGGAGDLTDVPCGAGSPAAIISLFAQGGFIYAGRYGEQSLGLTDAGGVTLTPTAQGSARPGCRNTDGPGSSSGTRRCPSR